MKQRNSWNKNENWPFALLCQFLSHHRPFLWVPLNQCALEKHAPLGQIVHAKYVPCRPQLLFWDEMLNFLFPYFAYDELRVMIVGTSPYLHRVIWFSFFCGVSIAWQILRNIYVCVRSSDWFRLEEVGVKHLSETSSNYYWINCSYVL